VLLAFLHGHAAAGAGAARAHGARPSALTARDALVDALSPLLSILTPAIRPIGFAMLAEHERKAVDKLVEVRLWNG
jgi:hypothetical protein